MTVHPQATSHNAEHTAGDASPRASGITVRALETPAEHAACVVLQADTWGKYFALVPAPLLHVATRIGGLLLGAYSHDDVLVGFVFSLAGDDAGGRIHWSHMLAVSADARGMGIGLLLKEEQRAELARRNIDRVYWTFDPMQMVNARFNINRLGIDVTEYAEDMYGPSASALHLALPTDRLIVASNTASSPRVLPSSRPLDDAPVLTAFPERGDVAIDTRIERPRTALIEMPFSVDGLKTQAAERLLQWRLAIRHHCRWALANGYRFAAVHTDVIAKRVFYVVTRDEHVP